MWPDDKPSAIVNCGGFAVCTDRLAPRLTPDTPPDLVGLRVPEPPAAEGLPTPSLCCVAFDLFILAEFDVPYPPDPFTEFEVLDPEGPLERSDDTRLEERVETRRGGGWYCGFGGARPISGDIFELRLRSQ